jgi:hypothetical protein
MINDTSTNWLISLLARREERGKIQYEFLGINIDVLEIVSRPARSQIQFVVSQSFAKRFQFII